MTENVDRFMAEAKRQIALEKKRLTAKSKHGLTAGEVATLCPQMLPEELQDGSWYATGLRTPIDPNKGPERIAVYLWDVLEIDYYNNEAHGDGLHYVRLRFYKGDGNFDPLEPAPPENVPSAVRPKRRGRRKGTMGYDAKDTPLLEEMDRLIKSGEATGPWRAALLVVNDAKGTGNAESKIKRLVGKYDKKYRPGEGHSV